MSLDEASSKMARLPKLGSMMQMQGIPNKKHPSKQHLKKAFRFSVRTLHPAPLTSGGRFRTSTQGIRAALVGRRAVCGLFGSSQDDL